MNRGKRLGWETEELYVRFRHHDERRHPEVGYCHEIRIRDVGSMLDLHDEYRGAVPREREADGVLPARTRRMSGLTETLLPVESFEAWWEWFRSERRRPVVGVVECDVEEELGWWLEDVDAVQRA